MNRIYLVVLAFYLVGLSFSACSNKHKIPKSGKYITHFPGNNNIKYVRMIPMKINQIFLQHKHKKDFKDMVIVTLYLREDSSFVFSFCQNQIIKAGKYIFENDSLRLYNIFDFHQMKKSADEIYYVNKKGRTIFLTIPMNTDSVYAKKFKYKEQVTTVQYNKFRNYPPVIRNENWPLDSIYKFNVLWPLDKQFIYNDSIRKSRQNN